MSNENICTCCGFLFGYCLCYCRKSNKSQPESSSPENTVLNSFTDDCVRPGAIPQPNPIPWFKLLPLIKVIPEHQKTSLLNWLILELKYPQSKESQPKRSQPVCTCRRGNNCTCQDLSQPQEISMVDVFNWLDKARGQERHAVMLKAHSYLGLGPISEKPVRPVVTVAVRPDTKKDYDKLKTLMEILKIADVVLVDPELCPTCKDSTCDNHDSIG